MGYVAGVHLDPELTHGPLRRPVELGDQAVQALVPARAVACGLAELLEGVGQGEQGYRAALALDPPPAEREFLAVRLAEIDS